MNNATVEASHLGKAFGPSRCSRNVVRRFARRRRRRARQERRGQDHAARAHARIHAADRGRVRVFGTRAIACRATSRRASASCRSRTSCWTSSRWPISCASSRRSIRIGTPRSSIAPVRRVGRQPEARIKSMSVGERQKLSILLAFGHRPDLLILDEPVASLDPIARRQFSSSWSRSRRTASAPSCLLLAHRLGHRAAREPHLDPQGRPARLAGRSRFAQGVDRAPAHPRRRPRYRHSRFPARSTAPRRRLRDRGGARLDAGSAGGAGEKRIRAVEVETLGLEEIFLELHR